MTTPTILLDIMEHGRFICQIPYFRRGIPILVNGKVVEVHDTEELERYVYEARPSLRNRKINIAFARQRATNNNH
jgi:hypothetical protein